MSSLAASRAEKLYFSPEYSSQEHGSLSKFNVESIINVHPQQRPKFISPSVFLNYNMDDNGDEFDDDSIDNTIEEKPYNVTASINLKNKINEFNSYIEQEIKGKRKIIAIRESLIKSQVKASLDGVHAVYHRLILTKQQLKIQSNQRLLLASKKTSNNTGYEDNTDIDSDTDIDLEELRTKTNVQDILTRPEHFNRNIGISKNHLSPWEGSKFKVTLLISLIRKLELKVIFNALRHNVYIHESLIQATISCLTIKNKKMLQLCFHTLILECLENSYIFLESDQKARKLYLYKKTIPLLKSLSNNCVRSKINLYLYNTSNNFQIKNLLKKGLKLLMWNRKFCIRRKSLSEWSLLYRKKMCLSVSLASWTLSFLRRNLLRISLENRLNKNNILSNQDKNKNSFSDSSSVNSDDDGLEYNDKLDKSFHDLKENVFNSLKKISSFCLYDLNYLLDKKSLSTDNIYKNVSLLSPISVTSYINREDENIFNSNSNNVSFNNRVAFAKDSPEIIITTDIRQDHDYNAEEYSLLDECTYNYINKAIEARNNLKGIIGCTDVNMSLNSSDINDNVRSKNNEFTNIYDSFNNSFKSGDKNGFNILLNRNSKSSNVNRSLLDSSIDISLLNGREHNTYRRDNRIIKNEIIDTKYDIELEAATRLIKKCKRCFNKLKSNAQLSIAYRSVKRLNLKFILSSTIKIWKNGLKKVYNKYNICDKIKLQRNFRVFFKRWINKYVKRFIIPISNVNNLINYNSLSNSIIAWNRIMILHQLNEKALELYKKNKKTFIFNIWRKHLSFNSQVKRVTHRNRRYYLKYIIIKWKLYNKFQNKLTILKKSSIGYRLLYLIKIWRVKSVKLSLLRRVFTMRQNIINHQNHLYLSQYSFLLNIITSWSDWAVNNRIARINAENDRKSLLFRGISLNARVFYHWQQVTNSIRIIKLNIKIKNDKLMLKWLRICYLSWASVTMDNNILVKENRLKQRPLRLRFYFNQLKKEISKCVYGIADSFYNNNLLRKYFDLLNDYRYLDIVNYLHDNYCVTLPNKFFNSWARIYFLRRRVKLATKYLNKTMAYIKFRLIFKYWPGRWQFKKSEEMRLRLLRRGRGRSRLVEIKGYIHNSQLKVKNKNDTHSFLQPSTSRTTILQRMSICKIFISF
jgi:hypothetical protein